MEIGIFFFALLSPLLYAVTNHIDNILLEKYFKEGGVGTLILFSAFLAAIALPVLFLIDPTVMDVAVQNRWYLAGVGLLNVVLLWAYLQALFSDEPTVVITYYQFVPLLGLLMGYFVLGETITMLQAFAMLVIIVGAIVLTVAQDADGVWKFRWSTAGYMLLASTCWAAESTFFKVVALDENPTRSFFWEHIALVSIGIMIFILVRKYRENFLRALKLNSKPVIGLNVLNESLYISGNYIAALVVVMIPVSLTLLMNSFQPIFVLITGLALAVVFPKLDMVHVEKRNMTQKIVAILLTGIGVMLLSF